jgi:type IV secretory pathway protease TraF
MTLIGVVQACRHFAGCNMKRPITILPNHYFVMGDNSATAADSRHWGPVPARAIVGEVIDDETD